MINLDIDLQLPVQKLNASRSDANRTLKAYSEAVSAAARNADGVRLELLRNVRATGRRLGVFLAEEKPIDMRDLNLQLADIDIGERIAFKALLAQAGLIA
jgi:hypothetical protein